MKRHIRLRGFVAALLAASSAVALGAASSAGATAVAAAPQRGGIVNVSVSTWSSLDPAQPNFGALQFEIGFAAYDTLFTPEKVGAGPELAQSYAYSNHLKTLTINLRPGVKFQDGTALNAQAVAFNFRRFQSIASPVSPYFSSMTAVHAAGTYKVVVTMSAPDANLIQVLSSTPAGFMVSPTAYQSEGAANFGLMPIGAGPFKVTSDLAGVAISMSSWPGYYAAKTRYLAGLHFAAIATGDQVELADMQAGSLDEFYDTSQGTPSVIQSAKSDPALTIVSGPSQTVESLTVNTYAAPFSNQLAREALDYCMPRASIAKYVMDGLGTPAYIWDAPGMSYWSGPKPGNQASYYPYDVAKGSALVQQLGGLSFTLLVNTKASEVAQGEAMQSAWQACGMKVQLSSVSSSVQTTDTDSGNYNLSFSTGGGYFDPYLALAPTALPGGAVKTFFSKTIADLVGETGYTTNPQVLTALWARVFNLEAQLAVNIPLAASPNYYVFTSKLHGLSFISLAAIFDKAWES